MKNQISEQGQRAGTRIINVLSRSEIVQALTSISVKFIILHYQRNTKELRIFIVVPNQQLSSRWDFLECSVKDISTVLKSVHVLFLNVTCAANETHPAGGFFVTSIEIMA